MKKRLPGAALLLLSVGLSALAIKQLSAPNDRPRAVVKPAKVRNGYVGGRTDVRARRNLEPADPRDYQGASPLLPPMPEGSRVLFLSSKTRDGLKETTVRLDTPLSPVELQLHYTDFLLKDWIVLRDSLTESIGWSGVFLQIGKRENRLGVFGVVREVSARPGVRSAVSMKLVEEQ